MTVPPAELARLRRRGFRLEYASMAWMTAEAVAALIIAALAVREGIEAWGEAHS